MGNTTVVAKCNYVQPITALNTQYDASHMHVKCGNLVRGHCCRECTDRFKRS